MNKNDILLPQTTGGLAYYRYFAAVFVDVVKLRSPKILTKCPPCLRLLEPADRYLKVNLFIKIYLKYLL
jgi:hypothetical protein